MSSPPAPHRHAGAVPAPCHCAPAALPLPLFVTDRNLLSAIVFFKRRLNLFTSVCQHMGKGRILVLPNLSPGCAGPMKPIRSGCHPHRCSSHSDAQPIATINE